MGKTAAFARRKGETWYVGVINGDAASTLDLSLKFLGTGTLKSEQFGDSPEKNNTWKAQETSVKSGDTLKIDLRDNGGFVARFTR